MKTYQPVNDKDTSKGGKPGKRKRQQRKRIDTSKYCWSCGAWNHMSVQCKRENAGHKGEATLQDKMNSSTYYCRITQE